MEVMTHVVWTLHTGEQIRVELLEDHERRGATATYKPYAIRLTALHELVVYPRSTNCLHVTTAEASKTHKG